MVLEASTDLLGLISDNLVPADTNTRTSVWEPFGRGNVINDCKKA